MRYGHSARWTAVKRPVARGNLWPTDHSGEGREAGPQNSRSDVGCCAAASPPTASRGTRNQHAGNGPLGSATGRPSAAAQWFPTADFQHPYRTLASPNCHCRWPQTTNTPSIARRCGRVTMASVGPVSTFSAHHCYRLSMHIDIAFWYAPVNPEREK